MMLCQRQRAIVRSLEQTTALPFLYHTPTITRRYATAEDPNDDDSHNSSKKPFNSRGRFRDVSNVERRNHDSPRGRPDFVPFEGSRTSRGSDIDIEGSTITPKERRAFESLMKLQEKAGRDTKSKASNQAAKRAPGRKSAQTILDEIMESVDEEEDEAENAVSTPLRVSTRAQDRITQDPRRSQNQNESEAIAAAVAKDLRAVRALVYNARTDVEVWNILQKKVLTRVRALNLDGPPEKNPKNKKTRQQHPNDTSASTTNPPAAKKQKTQTTITDLEILTHTLPYHLTRAHKVLIEKFPSSALPLALLPHLRTLGPSAFALGTSTALYDLHMTALFRQTLDLDAIAATLREMDEQVYPFSDRTVALLRKVIEHAKKAEAGVWGEGVRVFWGSSWMRRSLGKLFMWERIVKQRREEEALREAQRREAEEADEGNGKGEREGEREAAPRA